MSTEVRSWLYSTSQMRLPLPPSLCPTSTAIPPSLSPLTRPCHPPPHSPHPRWRSLTAPPRRPWPLLPITSTLCCWSSWSSLWCLGMCWYVWRCHESVPCRPPPTTSSCLWRCPTCSSPHWSCHGASTWRCVSLVIDKISSRPACTLLSLWTLLLCIFIQASLRLSLKHKL